MLGVDRPVYGLQTVIPAGPAGENGHLPTMEELSAQYLSAVREVQAEGPWLLAGWSVGAVAAYEMARQIESSGGTVELLAMIDPFAPPEGRSEDGNDSFLLQAFAAMGEIMGRQVEPEVLRRVQETVAGLDVDAGFGRMAELARAERILPMKAHLLDADHYSLLRKLALDRLVELFRRDLTEIEGENR